MLRLIGIVISIGLADSVNPSTVAPALYLASGPDARKTVSQFTVAVFLVYLLGGALIGLGPGQLVLSLVPKPDAATRHVLEVVAGGVLIAAGVLLWRYRGRLSHKPLPLANPDGRASWLLGAAITAVELPTAFPYFAAIAAIVGSGEGIAQQVILFVIFNVCFVLPLIGILATLWLAGEEAECRLARARGFLERHWPLLLAVVALIAGGITIALGATGAIRQVKRTLKKTIG
ncbi:MAG TPA: GAP family protein [Solirubrobacteraceae bacterium]|jgi:cytochrome c biogenesis protein CcdA|nr:GAP family protein [Solirubrobacteraceae bacterium]